MNKEINLEKRLKVAELIRKAREAKGLSQEQLAERVDFKGNTIWRIEAGRFSPNADQLYAICEALGITLTLDSIEI